MNFRQTVQLRTALSAAHMTTLKPSRVDVGPIGRKSRTGLVVVHRPGVRRQELSERPVQCAGVHVD
jgi:hypothetical protein